MSSQRRTQQHSRRQFLTDTARGACAATAVGLGLSAYASQASRKDPQALRPPGALDEQDFLSACLRCGLCVDACPYDTLKLARLFDPAPSGTPVFEARKVACEMCDDVPCVPACPSGALDPQLTDINDARMGTAVLIDQKNCLNFQGLRCDVCYRVCPLIDEAITLEASRNQRTRVHSRFLPTVNSDICTGCGKCEQACVLDEAAIKVLPTALAVAGADDHYQLSWEVEAERGAPLVPQKLHMPAYEPEKL